MTDVRDAPATAPALLPRPLQQGWSGRRKAWLVAGLVAAVTGAAAWALVPGAAAVGQTKVLLDARPFTCARASDATTWADRDFKDADERVYVPAVRLHPGLDCTMELVVRNDSDVDVAVDSITIPLAGPSNGIGIHAYRAAQQGIVPIGGRDALDAVFDYQHTPAAGGSYGIAPHSLQRFGFHLSWSGGCMDDGTAISFTESPKAVITAGPWHVATSGAGAGYAFLGGRSTVAARCNP